MPEHKNLTVQQQVRHKTPPGYGGYTLYEATESNPSFPRRVVTVYLLTRDTHYNGEKITINVDDIIPLANSITNMIDGYPVYVRKPREMALSGHFRVVARIPAADPYENFASIAPLPTSRFNQYLVEHHDGASTKRPQYKIFSEISYFKGEDIPAGETTRLYRRYPSENLEFLLHDASLYRARAARALFTQIRFP